MGLFRKTEAQKREKEEEKAVSSFNKICSADRAILGQRALNLLSVKDGQELTSIHTGTLGSLFDEKGLDFYKKELYGFLVSSAREGNIQRRIENGVMKFYLTEQGKTKLLERQDKASS